MDDEVTARTTERLEKLERQVQSLRRQVARRPSVAPRWVGTIALVAAVATPMLAWTYTRPHPAFEPGTPISSGQMNDTFDDVYDALNTLDGENARVSAEAAIDAAGGLPVSGGFDSEGGTVVLFVSGSAWRTDAAGTCGVDVLVDGTSVGTVTAYTNEPDSHKALVSAPLVLARLAAGAHTVELQPLSGTSSDFNDPYRVVALELPR